VNVNSDIFKSNIEAMAKTNKDLDDKLKQILQGGGEKANQRHLDRGKLLGIESLLFHM
jgi:3-methylcrotonyl-CoA carboxylase beta subunit